MTIVDKPKDSLIITEQTQREAFLLKVEKKISNPIHQRLLSICRKSDIANALEAELGAIIREILGED